MHQTHPNCESASGALGSLAAGHAVTPLPYLGLVQASALDYEKGILSLGVGGNCLLGSGDFPPSDILCGMSPPNGFI